AEDGIRDLIVTGVQTCALPILAGEDPLDEARPVAAPLERREPLAGEDERLRVGLARGLALGHAEGGRGHLRVVDAPREDSREDRSEERRVGKSVVRGGRRSSKK